MSAPVELPGDVVYPYPVVTPPTFPHGLRCTHCGRAIGVGRPFDRHVTRTYTNGDTLAHLACVYCPCDEPLLGVADTDHGTDERGEG